MYCVVCKNEIVVLKKYTKLNGRKFCSSICRAKNSTINRSIEKKCKNCNIDFFGLINRLYCSSKCSGLYNRERLIKDNKKRRKYAEVPGFTRKQIYWRNNNSSRLKHLERDAQKRLQLIKFLGGKCVRCGYKSDDRALCLDHIHSDGKNDRKERGSRIYRYYVHHFDEARKKLQVLCYNCNTIKIYEKQEHNISRRI